MWSRKTWKSHDATRRYWVEWAETSPFSPYNLGHLEPPVPAGVSPGDSHLFGFEDAFEDLMATSQGKPMMNLHTEVDFRRGFYKIHPYGEPPQLWVDRLVMRGLMPPPLPSPSVDGRAMDRTSQESEILNLLKGQAAQQERLAAIQSQRRAMTSPPPMPEELTQQIEELREKILKKLDHDVTFNPATIARQWEENFKNLEKAMDPAKLLQQAMDLAFRIEKDMENFDAAKMRHLLEQAASLAAITSKRPNFDKDNREEPSKPLPTTQDHQKPQPDTEEDFFSAIFGALMEANTSVNRPSKSATSQAPHGSSQVQQQQSPRQYGELMDGERQTVEDNEHGGKTIRWTSVSTSPFGAAEVVERTEVQILDAQGTTISHETRTISRAGGAGHGLPRPRKMAAEDDEIEQVLMDEQIKKWSHSKEAEARQKEEDAMGKASECKKSGGGWFWR